MQYRSASPAHRSRPRAICDACAAPLSESAAADLLGKIACKSAGPEDLRIRDARHHYISWELAPGKSLPMIGQLIGHTQVQTTARYAHPAEDPLRVSDVPTSDSIAADIL